MLGHPRRLVGTWCGAGGDHELVIAEAGPIHQENLVVGRIDEVLRGEHLTVSGNNFTEDLLSVSGSCIPNGTNRSPGW
ncbi:hypothetical protein BH23ACT5_BH23ACT5_06630 [soil metagenome]